MFVTFQLIHNLLEESVKGMLAADARSKRKRHIKMLDAVPGVVATMICGSSNHSREDIIKSFATVFRRFPKILMDVIRTLVEDDARMKKVFLSALVDINEVERAFLLQNVQLKYGGKVPNKRWILKMSPVLRATVQSLHCMINFIIICDVSSQFVHALLSLLCDAHLFSAHAVHS